MKFILEREDLLLEKELDPFIEKEFNHACTIASNIINDYTFGKRGEKFLSFFNDNYGDNIIKDIEAAGMELDYSGTVYTYKDYIKILYSPLNKGVYMVLSKTGGNYTNFAKAYYIGTPGNLKYLEDFKFKEDKYGFVGWSAKKALINSPTTSQAINYNRILHQDLDERYLGKVYASNMLSKGVFVYMGKFYLRLRCLNSGTVQCQVTTNIKNDVNKNYDELDPIINNNLKKSVGQWQLIGNIYNMSSIFEVIDNILKQTEKKIIHIDKNKDTKTLVKKLSSSLTFLNVRSNLKRLRNVYEVPTKKGKTLETFLNKFFNKNNILSKDTHVETKWAQTAILYKTKYYDESNLINIYYDSKTNEFFGLSNIDSEKQLINDIFYIGTTTKIYDEKNLINIISKKRESYNVSSSIELEKSSELTKFLYNKLLNSEYKDRFMEYKDDKLFFHLYANIFLLLTVNEGGTIISNIYLASKNLTRDLEKTKTNIIHISSLGSIYNFKRLYIELKRTISFLPNSDRYKSYSE